MTDRRIRAARQAELKAFVEANATEHEKADLIFASAAGVRVKFGFTLRDLAAAADPDEDYVPTGKFRYNPEALAEIAGRIKLRRELRLPARECVVRKPPPEASHCICLTGTLDSLVESGQAMTRGEVLKAARKAHTERWAWLKNRPKPRPEPLAAGPGPKVSPQTDEPISAPVPAAVVTETSTKPFRVVKRSPKWWDGPSGADGIGDKVF